MARAKRSGDEERGQREGPAQPDGAPSFEAALEALEGVVARLESGELPLEQALEAFEHGVRLSRQCTATLDAAERRIEILMAERGGLQVRPFEKQAPVDDGDADDVGESGDETGDETDGETGGQTGGQADA